MSASTRRVVADASKRRAKVPNTGARKAPATHPLWLAERVGAEAPLSYAREARADMRRLHVGVLDVRHAITTGQKTKPKYSRDEWPTYRFDGLTLHGARIRVDLDIIESPTRIAIVVARVSGLN